MCRKAKVFKHLKKRLLDRSDDCGKQKVACAIVKGNKILFIGENKYKTSPIQKEYAKHDKALFLHAEVDAIKQAIAMYGKKEISDCDIYIARTKKVGKTYEYGLAKPCVGCMKLIHEVGFSNVIYTNDSNSFEKCGTHELVVVA